MVLDIPPTPTATPVKGPCTQMDNAIMTNVTCTTRSYSTQPLPKAPLSFTTLNFHKENRKLMWNLGMSLWQCNAVSLLGSQGWGCPKSKPSEPLWILEWLTQILSHRSQTGQSSKIVVRFGRLGGKQNSQLLLSERTDSSSSCLDC